MLGALGIGKGGGSGGIIDGGKGGGGGTGADTSTFFGSTLSSGTESVCVSMEINSEAFGKTIGSTSITVALSTIRFFSVVFFGDVSNWAHRLHPLPLEISEGFCGEVATTLTEPTERFLLKRFGSGRVVDPVGVLGDVRDLTGVFVFIGEGVFV